MTTTFSTLVIGFVIKIHLAFESRPYFKTRRRIIPGIGSAVMSDDARAAYFASISQPISIEVDVSTWSLSVVITVVLAIRFYSRLCRPGMQLWTDDFVMLAGYISVLATQIIVTYMVSILAREEKIVWARIYQNIQAIALGLTKTPYGITLLRLMPAGWQHTLIIVVLVTMNLEFLAHALATWQKNLAFSIFSALPLLDLGQAEPYVTIIAASIPVLRGFVKSARTPASNSKGISDGDSKQQGSQPHFRRHMKSARKDIRSTDNDNDISILGGRDERGSTGGGIIWTHEISVQYEDPKADRQPQYSDHGEPIANRPTHVEEYELNQFKT
ncbi:hypothetical protein BU23DRAFT_571568 [Bimuria novae-zelandiae CBS 107.79]|uniref:Integral membrane protein n=1 Tax=Bimuria novae-zelandiae CBS 107.79 TaxID=1447943 RepID=A0A6A5UXF5_9PLEO|nr:hypothetical protein BU23DRAFT_571568 [Bimuria novae-zelandiae CBS 107.79]